ncbi:MAG: aldehyde dehydrogenase family protein [Acidimicrobiales bacterium]
MYEHNEVFIDGAWVPSAGKGVIDVVNPATEEVIGHIPNGNADDVDRAARAARAAFPAWAATPKEERGKYIQRLQEGLGARMQEIGKVVSQEMGMPMTLSVMVQAGLPAMVMGSYTTILENYSFEEPLGSSLIVREPVGVVGCITPWNYPLHQIVAKVAPALAAGCTVVLKPSEVAPLNAFILAEIIEEVGLPAGVFNLVTGTGPIVGEAIAAHPEINMVSFTGSTAAGKRVSEVASQTVKRVALELGGKSPFIILDDANLADAVKAGVGNCYINSGQTCIAWTRMLVPRDKQDEIVALVKDAAEAYTPGDPFEPATRLGPLVSKTQQDRVRSYIEKGIAEGATLVTGGAEQPEGLDKGYFVKPTVFSNVTNDMTIAREEIFGPVLSILPYDDEEDAIRIANDTIYGLHAGVYSADKARATRVAKRIEAGQVTVNDGSFNPMAPFGGYKQSGHGRELGVLGLEEFLEVKALML